MSASLARWPGPLLRVFWLLDGIRRRPELPPSGRRVVTANGGPGRYSLTIMERDREGKWTVQQLGTRSVDAMDQDDASDWRGISMGVAFSGEHAVFSAEGNSGRISLLDSSANGFGERRRVIDLNQNGYRDSY